jgi:hypothetical protein
MPGFAFVPPQRMLLLTCGGLGGTFRLVPTGLAVSAALGPASISVDDDGPDFRLDTGLGWFLDGSLDWTIHKTGWSPGFQVKADYHVVPDDGQDNDWKGWSIAFRILLQYDDW